MIFEQNCVQDSRVRMEVPKSSSLICHLAEYSVAVSSAPGRQNLRSVLLVPRTRTSCRHRSFVVYRPSTWNSSPAALRSPELTLPLFKYQLKTYHFQRDTKVFAKPSGATVTVKATCHFLRLALAIYTPIGNWYTIANINGNIQNFSNLNILVNITIQR